MLSQLIDKSLLRNSLNKEDSNPVNHSYPQQQPNLIQPSCRSFQAFQQIQQPLFGRHSYSISGPIQLYPSNNSCPDCQKTFIKHAHLVRHLSQRHSDNRSFVCKEQNCGKTFKRDSHLRRHMISHTHQKKFKCSQCIMAFGYKHHLDRHIKSVHQKVLLQCKECGQSFAKKKQLLKHAQKIHSIKNKVTKADALNNIEKSILEKEQKQHLNQGQQQKLAKRSNKKKIKKIRIKSEKNSMSDINQKYSEQLMFRCIYVDCVSAFVQMNQLIRHIKQKHNQNFDS